MGDMEMQKQGFAGTDQGEFFSNIRYHAKMNVAIGVNI